MFGGLQVEYWTGLVCLAWLESEKMWVCVQGNVVRDCKSELLSQVYQMFKGMRQEEVALVGVMLL